MQAFSAIACGIFSSFARTVFFPCPLSFSTISLTHVNISCRGTNHPSAARPGWGLPEGGSRMLLLTSSLVGVHIILIHAAAILDEAGIKNYCLWMSEMKSICANLCIHNIVGCVRYSAYFTEKKLIVDKSYPWTVKGFVCRSLCTLKKANIIEERDDLFATPVNYLGVFYVGLK